VADGVRQRRGLPPRCAITALGTRAARRTPAAVAWQRTGRDY